MAFQNSFPICTASYPIRTAYSCFPFILPRARKLSTDLHSRACSWSVWLLCYEMSSLGKLFNLETREKNFVPNLIIIVVLHLSTFTSPTYVRCKGSRSSLSGRCTSTSGMDLGGGSAPRSLSLRSLTRFAKIYSFNPRQPQPYMCRHIRVLGNNEPRYFGKNSKIMAESHNFTRHIQMYRDALKGGPVSLSNSQAGPGRNCTQPTRTHFLVNPCTLCASPMKMALNADCVNDILRYSFNKFLPRSSGAAADPLHDDEGGRGAAGDVLFVVGRVGLLGDPFGPAAVVGARRARLAAVDGRRVLPRRQHAPPVPQGALGE